MLVQNHSPTLFNPTSTQLSCSSVRNHRYTSDSSKSFNQQTFTFSNTRRYNIPAFRHLRYSFDRNTAAMHHRKYIFLSRFDDCNSLHVAYPAEQLHRCQLVSAGLAKTVRLSFTLTSLRLFVFSIRYKWTTKLDRLFNHTYLTISSYLHTVFSNLNPPIQLAPLHSFNSCKLTSTI